jgi:hypothetical protein
MVASSLLKKRTPAEALLLAQDLKFPPDHLQHLYTIAPQVNEPGGDNLADRANSFLQIALANERQVKESHRRIREELKRLEGIVEHSVRLARSLAPGANLVAELGPDLYRDSIEGSNVADDDHTATPMIGASPAIRHSLTTLNPPTPSTTPVASSSSSKLH